MASGFGLSGGTSRCFVYWQEFSKCYTKTDFPQECQPQVDDYLECLHHTKEIERAKTVRAEFVKKSTQATKEGRILGDTLADGGFVGIGLIPRSPPDAAEK
ncbi:hypothetical protein BDV98DRAFT_562341 [Pterulicium gracile]|uniref:NADH dehydrogenase [ubiquinone] iron-sulfur protein 5 n=1 Tax=Pterulicium gracile TaxID=1884261 RepID=A0A5C3QRK6_9AGAR|nr:hypothetical protein BDV98DRAFT_562341 [Pterula gracilis]